MSSKATRVAAVSSAVMLSAFLAACGGGGGSSPAVPVPGQSGGTSVAGSKFIPASCPQGTFEDKVSMSCLVKVWTGKGLSGEDCSVDYKGADQPYSYTFGTTTVQRPQATTRVLFQNNIAAGVAPIMLSTDYRVEGYDVTFRLNNTENQVEVEEAVNGTLQKRTCLLK